MFRIGHGYDAHRFSEETTDSSFITMGGVAIDHPQTLIAHSDGDVLLHAFCDSMLGALALGDIGQHFPDTDNQFKNIDSRELLRSVFQKIKAMGYQIGNADMTIVAQAPKMSPHLIKMRQLIAQDCECDISQINIKATTTEKMGFTGRKEGIASHAVVLLKLL
ncbi:MAG: 2-C-methyl-D-erythritol 2,4-cyclodiphosphate synthase [Gammaproteobacteria bacterium]|nr:2-C-methyl-D-erythritol 2,4-cyclodiphosphate synthase [Gammaproteobacteria bacterium]